MILYGAGGHARVVFESLSSSGVEIKGIIDDDPKVEFFNGFSVSHFYSPDFFMGEKIILAIGDNQQRSILVEKIRHTFASCIDFTSHISESAKIGVGTTILAKCVLQTACEIGQHVIINTGAIIEHDCLIKDFVHIGPGSVICGGVKIGKGVLVGANSTILPGLEIGEQTVIGAGSVVLENVQAGSRVAGNPAKKINR
jgi:sugar O-acyltransferase (sialic acid O-acetyltransferase NeuD family)